MRSKEHGAPVSLTLAMEKVTFERAQQRNPQSRNNLYRNGGVWFTNRCVSLLF